MTLESEDLWNRELADHYLGEEGLGEEEEGDDGGVEGDDEYWGFHNEDIRASYLHHVQGLLESLLHRSYHPFYRLVLFQGLTRRPAKTLLMRGEGCP
jgi:hypothetical protein